MKKIKHYSNYINDYFENGSEILPSNGQEKFYDLYDVEVFKITII